jgi:hypothetical protein
MGGLGCYFFRLRDCLWNHISHHKRQSFQFPPLIREEERKETVKNVIYHKHSLQQTTFHIFNVREEKQNKIRYENIFILALFYSLRSSTVVFCPWNAWHSLKLISHVKSLKIHPQKYYVVIVYLFLIASREFRELKSSKIPSIQFSHDSTRLELS